MLATIGQAAAWPSPRTPAMPGLRRRRASGVRLVTGLVTGLIALLAGCSVVPPAADPGSDAPEPRRTRAVSETYPAHYDEALALWRRPEDVHAWIGQRFAYDGERAVALSESQRAAGPAPAIHDPAAFYGRPVGVCVDLARFAVETLRRVAPEVNPRYLMIEFDPLTLRGQVLRRHWVAVYDGADGIRVMADSKRPDVLAGPYPSVAAFVAEYARFRGRDVVAFQERAGYQRQKKRRAQSRRPDA